MSPVCHRICYLFLELIGIKDYFSASVALYVVMLVASTAAFSPADIHGQRILIFIGNNFMHTFRKLM
tara:strand:+ start:706 stop:906 length:201 start_codon:yes stop_codon:yes gene_type:complete